MEKPVILSRRYELDFSPRRHEIHDRFVFQLDVTEAPTAEWVHHELHDRLRPPTAFCFSWLALGDPELDRLEANQGAMLVRLEGEEWPPHGPR